MNPLCVQIQQFRKAIAMGIDKESFVTTLLEGNGYPANGVFPEGSAFGGDKVTTESYDPEGAKKVLEEAGWKDSDGDGIREKDGKKLVVKWLTYPSRQELPLLAESVQATLKDIGIEVDINCTADNNSILARSDSLGCLCDGKCTGSNWRPGILVYCICNF